MYIHEYIPIYIYIYNPANSMNFYRAKSFIRIPVYFTPTDANSKSEGVLEVSALIGSSQTSYVRLTGICHSRS